MPARGSLFDTDSLDVLTSKFPHLDAFRATYIPVVAHLRRLLSTREPFARPSASRELHPFVQGSPPEIMRDKFRKGRILSKNEFADAAIAREHPLAAALGSMQLDTDLQIAIGTLVARGERIVSDREERMAILRSLAAELEPLRAAIDECKSPEARAIALPFNVAFTAACIDALGHAWPDKRLPLLYTIGFNVVFDIEDSGVFRSAETPASITRDEFMAGNTRMNAKTERILRSSATKSDPDEVARRKACWERTKEEIAQGLVSKPKSRAQIDRKYGRGRWRALKRSAIWQKRKWRCIDNGKFSKHNKATRTRERLTTGRADFPLVVTRAFAKAELARRRSAKGISKRPTYRLLKMTHGTNDQAAAYRHTPTSEPQFTVAATWNEDKHDVSYIEVPGHNFGLTSAVLNYNRFPELAVVVTRRLLWVVTEHFYDDMNETEPGWAQSSGQRVLKELFGSTFFGFPTEDEKDIDMAVSNEYLGVESDLSSADEGVLRIDVSRKRRSKLKDLADEALRTNTLRSGMAASIYGKGRFMLSPIYGSMGKSCLQPIIAREYQREQRELTLDIRESLEFISFTCDYLPPLQIPTLPSSRKKITVFTDAEGRKRKGKRPPSGHLGFVVYHPDRGKVHAHAEVPQSIIALMDGIKQRSTYIGQFELIAAITPFISLPADWFTGYPIELWIDNAGAIGGLVKGYSGVPDVARIINVFEFSMATLGAASLYIDYVPSESNPADVPSRAHELSTDEADRLLAGFGTKVSIKIPDFADASGSWKSFIDIAASVWGPSRPLTSKSTSTC